MERNTYGERHDDKYLLVYDTNTSLTEKIRLPTRDLCEIEIDVSGMNITDLGKELDLKINSLDLTNKISRLKITIDENMTGFLTKGKLKERLYDQNAHFVSSINVNPVYTKISRNLDPLKEGSDYAIFNKFLDIEFTIDEKLKKKILTAAKDIIGV